MLQRIQTLYLLIAAVLMALTAWLPLAAYAAGGERFELTAFGIRTAGETPECVAMLPYLGVLVIIAALLPFISIFLYRRRLLQIRLCAVEMVLLIGAVALVAYYLYHGTSAIGAADGTTVKYSIVCSFSLVSLILTWLAIRAIGKDEALVRSLDRIR